jgi:hypothetical protein
MSLVMQAIERSRAEVAAQRQQAAAVYREVLLRNDAPREGDEQALLDAMRALARTPADLPADLALARRLQELQELAATADEHWATLTARNVEWVASDEWAAKAREALEREIAARVGATTAARSSAEVSATAAKLARANLPWETLQWDAIVQGVPVADLRNALVAARRTPSVVNQKSRHDDGPHAAETSVFDDAPGGLI